MNDDTVPQQSYAPTRKVAAAITVSTILTVVTVIAGALGIDLPAIDLPPGTTWVDYVEAVVTAWLPTVFAYAVREWRRRVHPEVPPSPPPVDTVNGL
jgi:hypothetical protein